MAAIGLPRTASELKELHGIDPVSLGDATDFKQVYRSDITNSLASSTLTPGLTNRLVYTYVVSPAINGADYNFVRLALVFRRNSSIVGRIPMERGKNNTGTLPSQINGQSMLINAGLESPATSLNLVEGGIIATMLNDAGIELYLAPFALNVIADNMEIIVLETYNSTYRAYAGCYSTT